MRRLNRLPLRIGVVLAASALALCAATPAADNFDYPDGSLGASGGVGWGGSWASNVSVAVDDGAVRMVTGLAFRFLDEPIVPANGVKVYVGVDLGADPTKQSDFAGFSFFSGAREQLFIGMASDVDSYGLNITGYANQGSAVPVTPERRFVVGEFLFLSPTEVTVNVYVDPGRTLGTPGTTYTGPFDGGTLDQVRLASGFQVEASFDNLAIGERLEDVLGPLATDDFSYANGPLLANGSTGWDGGWFGLASVTDGVAMTAGLTNSQLLWGFRNLAEPIVPEAGKTVYLGFEMNTTPAEVQDFAGVSFYSGDDERLFAGMAFDQDSYGLNVAGIANIGSGTPVRQGWRSVVAEITFLSANELTMNVYVDPWIGNEPPIASYTGEFIPEGAWDRVRLASGGSPATTASFDHLVISERRFDVMGTRPGISNGGVVHAATFVSGGIAPGQIISIFGTSLGLGPELSATLDSQGRVATDADGVRVLFDGVPGAIFYAGQGQINVQAPYTINPALGTYVQVHRRGRSSNSRYMTVVPSNPGVFMNGDKPIILNGSRGGLVSAQAPARPGDIVVLYLTGEGATAPTSVVGVLAAAPYPTPQLPVTVTIGGDPKENCEVNSDALGPYHAQWSQGFHMYSLEWCNGSDDIRRNSLVFETALEAVRSGAIASGASAELGDAQPIIVIGGSMGGLVSRHALARIEEEGTPHGVSLFISFDSPQEGAYLPIGIQSANDYILNLGSNSLLTSAVRGYLIDALRRWQITR